jgi:hypothetical protein
LKTSKKKVRLKTLASGLKKIVTSFIQILRQKYLVFLFFVALSTLAWYIRALSEIYSTDVRYPVRYINLPKNRILSQAPPENLNLHISADGFTLLGYKLKLKRPLRFDVNSFSFYSLTSDSSSVYIVTRYALERLTAELSESNKNIQILSINPDTIVFNFSRLEKKKLPVVAMLKPNKTLFARQHMLNGNPYVIPDSLIVSGPSKIIDTLKQVFTKELDFQNLTDTVEKDIQLEQFSENVTFSIKKVKVFIPVDRYTESQFDIPVAQINVPDTLILKIFPKNVRIKYLITLSNFDRVTPETFKPCVDFNSRDIDLGTKLKIEVGTLPSYVHGVKIIPNNVEFLIEKQSAEGWNNRRDR